MNEKELRKLYTRLVDRKTDVQRWVNIKQEIIDSGLPMNEKTVGIFAAIKKDHPRIILNKEVFGIVYTMLEDVDGRGSLTGEEIKKLFFKYCEQLTYEQFYRCFYEIKSQTKTCFVKDGLYHKREFIRIFFLAASKHVRAFENSLKADEFEEDWIEKLEKLLKTEIF